MQLIVISLFFALYAFQSPSPSPAMSFSPSPSPGFSASPSPSPSTSQSGSAIPIFTEYIFCDLQSDRFTWIFALTMCASFLSSFSIGANDVSNSFANAVASGLLTMRQVILVAIFTEFLGAVALGSNVSSTIKSGLINITRFDDRQDLLMFGMFCALLGSGLWDFIATMLKLPVSTTHSIVGAVVGMGIAGFGVDGVNWSVSDGLTRVILGFILSPVLSGVIAAILFTITRFAVLERENSFRFALMTIPIYTFCTTVMILSFFVYKGSPRLGLDELETGKKLAIIFPPAVFLTFLSVVAFIPYIKWRIKRDEKTDVDVEGKKDTEMNNAAEEEEDKTESLEELDENKTCLQKTWDLLNRTILYGMQQNYAGARNERQEKLHANCKQYDLKTERVFESLQIFSCATASFAHGANDVANAIAPLSAVYAIWNSGQVGGKTDIPIWCLAYGGAGIDIGLILLGWRIMSNLGSNMTKMSPSRGFCAEMAAIISVLCATGFELPVSTTHCICGATFAIGLCNGNLKAVNWKLFGTIMLGWAFTIPMAGFFAGCLFAFAIHAPDKKFVDLYMNVSTFTQSAEPECLNITSMYE